VLGCSSSIFVNVAVAVFAFSISFDLSIQVLVVLLLLLLLLLLWLLFLSLFRRLLTLGTSISSDFAVVEMLERPRVGPSSVMAGYIII
jgi:hypothetical protein